MSSWRPAPVASRSLSDPGEPGPQIRWELEDGSRLHVSYDPDVSWQSYPAPGPPFLPELFHVRLDLPDIAYGLDVDVEVPAGRPGITRLAIDTHRRLSSSYLVDPGSQPKWRHRDTETAIGALELRKVGPQAVLRYCVAASLHREPTAGGVVPDKGALSLDDMDSALQERREGSGRKRYQLTDEHLAEVARVYTATVEAGRPDPVVRVRIRFARDGKPLPHTTASNWIRLARQKYPMPPARPTPKDGTP